MSTHEAQRIATALESIANSMNNGFSLDAPLGGSEGVGFSHKPDHSIEAMSAYGKVSYAVSELDCDLHRLSVGEIQIRIDRIKEKLRKLQSFV